MPKAKKQKTIIYEQYREILEMPEFTNPDIDKMRVSISLLAQIISQYIFDQILKDFN